jgi:hypothetical protein
MALAVFGCGAIIPPKIRPLEIVAFVSLVYIAICGLVSVCELTVVERGLIIGRLLSRSKFVPWDAVERVLVFSHHDRETGVQMEVMSIGIYEGLSLLNLLPGLVYGQGFRQTIIVLPDVVDEYEVLLDALKRHCMVIRAQARR